MYSQQELGEFENEMPRHLPRIIAKCQQMLLHKMGGLGITAYMSLLGSVIAHNNVWRCVIIMMASNNVIFNNSPYVFAASTA